MKRLLTFALLILATVAPAAATIPDANGVIHGCYKLADGKARIVESTCDSGEGAVQWNQTGPQGPAGPQGAPGPQGPQGPAGSSHQMYDANNLQVGDLFTFLGNRSVQVKIDGLGFVVVFKHVIQGTTAGQSTLLFTTPDCSGQPYLHFAQFEQGSHLLMEPFVVIGQPGWTVYEQAGGVQLLPISSILEIESEDSYPNTPTCMASSQNLSVVPVTPTTNLKLIYTPPFRVQ